VPQGAGFFFCRLPNVSLNYPIIFIEQSICGLGMETKKIILSLFQSLKNPFYCRATGAPGWGFCLRRYRSDAASFRDPILGKLGRRWASGEKLAPSGAD
jgi:lauroyl-KDO2-lipid IV(A) myristoyltransferase